MHVEVETPEEYAGQYYGRSLFSRGMVQGMEERFGSQIIRAETCPLAEDVWLFHSRCVQCRGPGDLQHGVPPLRGSPRSNVAERDYRQPPKAKSTFPVRRVASYPGYRESVLQRICRPGKAFSAQPGIPRRSNNILRVLPPAPSSCASFSLSSACAVMQHLQLIGVGPAKLWRKHSATVL